MTASTHCSSPTCLGLGPDWTTCCSDVEEKKEPPSKRFKFIDNEELQEMSKGFVPTNTSKNTKWGLNNFEAWKEERNNKYPDDPIPEDLLETTNEEILSLWLSRYVVETRNSTGGRYPPSTIYQLLTALLRSMRESNANCLNFLELKNSKFKMLHRTLNSLFRQLHESGVGTKVQHTEVITTEEENRLWESGVVGVNSPKSLLNAVFYCNGKGFCLRGGEEHRGLKLSQLQRLKNPDRYIYTENYSKNRSGTFDQLHIQKKVVPVICTCTTTTKSKCHVHILDLYISKLPSTILESKSLFYLRPLQNVPSDQAAPWYTTTPVGKNTLALMIRNMCHDIGISGKKTNHSLRATSVTKMFQAQVPEKIIQERTGHRSLAALRMYERTTEEQHKAASTILSSSFEQTFQQTLNTPQAPFQKGAPGQPSFNYNMTACTVNILQAPMLTPMQAVMTPMQTQMQAVMTPMQQPIPSEELSTFGISDKDIESFLKD